MRRFSKESFLMLYAERAENPFDYAHYHTVFQSYEAVLLTKDIKEFELFNKWLMARQLDVDCYGCSSLTFSPMIFLLISDKRFVKGFEEFVHAQFPDNISDIYAE